MSIISFDNLFLTTIVLIAISLIFLIYSGILFMIKMMKHKVLTKANLIPFIISGPFLIFSVQYSLKSNNAHIANTLIAISLILLIYSSVIFVVKLIKDKALTVTDKYIFIISATIFIFSALFGVKLYGQLGLVGRRTKALKALSTLAVKEHHYYLVNGKHASSFSELGLDTTDPALSNLFPSMRYSLYMYRINDIYFPEYGALPFCKKDMDAIKKDSVHIYAFYCNMDKLVDALSVDFDGNIKVIKSAAWPLPGP